jgi:alkanesulfonate monooxygenase SsuD/methylene tetrahydromethanopterin reductase-like flavin-dependent oxidoreductase (luciferase family)
LFEQTIPEDHPWADLHISPEHDVLPEMWMLGSTGGSAELAGQVGMNLALARFISPDHCSPDIFNAYDRAWIASGHEGTPKRMLAIGAFCAETLEEAELLASTAIYRKMMAGNGDKQSLFSPQAVQDFRKSFSPSQEAQYLHLLKGYTVGTPEQCKAEIEVLAEAFGVEEVAVVTVTHDFTARLQSYRLLQ